MIRVGQNYIFTVISTFTGISIYGAYTVFLAGKTPYLRLYTVQIYGSGQPCVRLWVRL
jgi:hypothetical protein